MLLILIILLSAPASVVISGGKTKLIQEEERDDDYLLFPKEDGSGYVNVSLREPETRLHSKSEKDIKFYLYTLKNQGSRQELIIGDNAKLAMSNFRAGAPLKILSHGFTGSSSDVELFKTAYLRNGLNYNVIAVDWAPLAEAPWYITAATATKMVGEKTARLVSYLVSRGMTTLSLVHFIGHSLGSHVGGYMGSHLGSGKVSRITALDPALPLFGFRPDSDRIDPSDAAFVDVIHTDAGALGFGAPRGHADFYPNDGYHQPGCGLDIVGACKHGRSKLYFAESIGNQNKFRACKCDSWVAYESGKCLCNTVTSMGEYASSSSRGSYYLYTNSYSPYSRS